MKILYITNNLDGKDGWGRYGLDIAKSIKEIDTLWLVANESEIGFKQEAVLPKPTRYLSHIFLIFTTARKINSSIKSFSPDVIHFLVEPYLTTLPFLNIKKIKIISTVHGTYSFLPCLVGNYFKRRLSLWWINLVYKRINIIVSVSNFTKDYLIRCLDRYKIRFVKERVVVINNGVNFNSFHNQREKKEIQTAKQILFVGAVKKRKGLEEAIKALKFYHDNFSHDFIFNIVGAYDEKDPYYLCLKLLISSYQLNDKIVFKNKVAESILRDFYAKADLFLMLSVDEGNKFEGFGLVYLEANACGVPCIGAKCSGAEDAILDGQTGYLANPNSVEEVAIKIDLILGRQEIDPEDCVSWAKRNDINIKVKELLEIYKVKK